MFWRAALALLCLTRHACNAIDDHLASASHHTRSGSFTRARQALEEANENANNAAQWRAVAEGRHQLGTAILKANVGRIPTKAAPELRRAAELLGLASEEVQLDQEKRAHARLMKGFCLQRLGEHKEAAKAIADSLEEDNHPRNRHMHLYVADVAASHHQKDMALAWKHFGLASAVHRPLRPDLLATKTTNPTVRDPTLGVEAVRNALPGALWLHLQKGFRAESVFWRAHQDQVRDPPRSCWAEPEVAAFHPAGLLPLPAHGTAQDRRRGGDSSPRPQRDQRHPRRVVARPSPAFPAGRARSAPRGTGWDPTPSASRPWATGGAPPTPKLPKPGGGVPVGRGGWRGESRPAGGSGGGSRVAGGAWAEPGLQLSRGSLIRGTSGGGRGLACDATRPSRNNPLPTPPPTPL